MACLHEQFLNNWLKLQAAREGLPYQTLIGNLIYNTLVNGTDIGKGFTASKIRI